MPDDDFEFEAGPIPERWEAPLDPCPWCPPGTIDSSRMCLGPWAGEQMWYVMCAVCGAQGPACASHYEAASEWGHVSDVRWK